MRHSPPGVTRPTLYLAICRFDIVGLEVAALLRRVAAIFGESTVDRVARELDGFVRRLPP